MKPLTTERVAELLAAAKEIRDGYTRRYGKAYAEAHVLAEALPDLLDAVDAQAGARIEGSVVQTRLLRERDDALAEVDRLLLEVESLREMERECPHRPRADAEVVKRIEMEGERDALREALHTRRSCDEKWKLLSDEDRKRAFTWLRFVSVREVRDAAMAVLTEAEKEDR